ncbi:MAG: SRPBCC family protein [Pseudolabrys sp.]
MSVKSNLDLEQDPRSIIGTRVLDAPRELVFSVWTDPKHLAQWWGPNGFTTTTHTFDFRPSGVWRFVMHGPDGRDYQNRITFDEITPPERIVYRHSGGDDVEPVQFTQTVTFEDLGNGQTRLTWHGRFPSAEERARVIREYGADKGLLQTMARLADYVVAMSSKSA